LLSGLQVYSFFPQLELFSNGLFRVFPPFLDQ
jgi:hypothetical protein